MKAETLWELYVEAYPEQKNKEYEAWAYGAAPDELALLTVDGVKRATASGHDLYEAAGEPIPQAGGHSIILDGKGQAVCVIVTTNVTVVPFNEVSAEFAYKEGEGDRSLAYWRAVHETFFGGEFARAELPFSETTLVVCEEFEVVYSAVELSPLRAFTEEKLGGDTTGHDMSHIARVENLAVSLAKQEKMAALDVVTIRAAVLLHDISDDKLTDDVAAAKQEVVRILSETVRSGEARTVILDTIENMSYSKNLKEKNELTAIGKIVQDADRLDAIGAIGIARTFYYGGSKGHAMYDDSRPFNPEEMDEATYRSSANVVNHFYEKLLRLESMMNTEAGKKMARERTIFMEEFLNQLALEIKGEK